MPLRKLLLSLTLMLAVVSMATAQEFWTKKPFNEWSNDDLKKFMTDSPWVKTLLMSTHAPSGDSLNMETGGGRGGGETAGDEPAGGGGGRGGRGGGRGASVPTGTMNIMVSWESALPVKEANVRAKMAHSGEVPSDAKQFLESIDTGYVILISGMPQNIAHEALSNAEKVKKSVLKIGKREIVVANVGTAQRGRNTDILLRFDKTQPIKVEDNEVEVDAKLGMFEVKKKFKLKDMVFNGKLEL